MTKKMLMKNNLVDFHKNGQVNNFYFLCFYNIKNI